MRLLFRLPGCFPPGFPPADHLCKPPHPPYQPSATSGIPLGCAVLCSAPCGARPSPFMAGSLWQSDRCPLSVRKLSVWEQKNRHTGVAGFAVCSPGNLQRTLPPATIKRLSGSTHPRVSDQLSCFLTAGSMFKVYARCGRV